MSAKRIADRAFFSINGFEVMLVKTAELTIDLSQTRASTMTRDYTDAGFKRGNKKVSVQYELDIDNLQAQIDPMLAKAGQDLDLVFECGGERFTAKDGSQGIAALRSSVGDASKTGTIEFLDVVNEQGQSVNVAISLG